MEEEELQDAMEETEYAIRQKEDRVRRYRWEFNKIRQEIGRRISKKEEELKGICEN